MKSESRKKDKYTYKDYLSWTDDGRWQLIDGIAYDMNPSPSVQHQRVLRKLLVRFDLFLEGKRCEVFSATFDVRLPEGDEEDEEVKTVVQPDILVVCDKSKLDKRGCKGAPDLIVEIVSNSSASMDYIKKLNLYERHGVKEYWIVNPENKTAMIYKQNEIKEYEAPEIYAKENVMESKVLEGFTVNLKEIFE
ncbi:Endonuclease, Uma2 family (restriction endonuclease fold) [Caldanaerovirga acetigignens]|uniref:Endonuclease, Uma2 family (Restriction endonuclease fold) n=1 Tax=Caldanaerovirga acetigignens TaxID=447595 RepID=A0A1M7LTU3_9FIRM|nr:Uma2 family endonuclease [Caldanaerovirga acetigignens]SHM81739.1 Endonuclease, Uma2 family (restriction endonuclease fold) [Caldanaerovirga acetigignens]